MKSINTHSEILQNSGERLSWALIATGAASMLAGAVIFAARFADINPAAPWAALGGLMTGGEAAFLLFPYLGLAYLRLYAAESVARQRVISAAATLFLVSGLAVSVVSMNGSREAMFNFYLHSLVAMALQGILTLGMVVGAAWSWWENRRVSAEIFALVPVAAAMILLMSMVSMKWVAQVTGPALLAPYLFLAADGLRRVLASLFTLIGDIVRPGYRLAPV
ncbi:MAG: hypothetical protein LBV79_10455 [Candidatus Adiutrix sp.]|jgi:hypothetical protein|nr:hypothetical protein [Candidatus Adiutrix sp.]